MSNTEWLTALKNSPVAKLNPHLFEKPQVSDAKKPRKIRKDCKQVVYLKEQLTYWCMINKLTLLVEHRFNEQRKYRFDLAIKELKVAVEYEGLNSEKSGHTTLKGFTKDTDKYNLAQSEGWKILRFTVLNYKTVIHELEKFNE